MLSAEIIHREEFMVKNGCHFTDSLIILLSGSFKCRISDTDFQANPYDIFVFNRNSTFRRNVIHPIECIYIQFERFPVLLDDGILKIKDIPRIQSTIKYLTAAIHSNNHTLTEHFINDIFSVNRLSLNVQTATADIVTDCIDYLKNNSHNKIDLDIISREFALSKQSLISKFKNYIGKTPMEYLSELRLSSAKELLVNSDMPIYEIAENCGFENIYYFSNKFKHNIGYSPSAYRKFFRL